MADTHASHPLIDSPPDVAPLTWLTGEIRTATQAAVASLREFLGAKGNFEALRGARNQVHLANGALQMLDLRGVSLLLESIEQLLRQWESAPNGCVPSSVARIERALEAVVAYLEGLRAGRADQPIRLFPHYRDILQLSGAPRVHPADLMFPDLTRRPAFHAIGVRPLTADQLRVRRARFEGALLAFLRDASNHTARHDMREALADLEKLPQRGLARSFWWVVRGLLDALDANAIEVDVDFKRVLARVNLQLRRLIDGGGAVAERLLVDALYYIGRADPRVARVAEARRLYSLDALLPPDFERSRLTLLDPGELRQLRDALVEAKSAWGQVVGGAAEPTAFALHIQAARRAAEKMDLPPIDLLLETVGTLGQDFATLPAAVREVLGLEGATALLLVDLGVDELPNLDERFAGRARAMVERLAAARRGQELPAVESWLTDLARRAQDRLTMQTVVAEMQGMLREIEQRLDRFFREPQDRAELPTIDGMIEQMGSVIALLGFDDAVAALADARAAVRRYADGATAANEADFARLAANLGAVGFFVETLNQETDRPQGMFHWDEASGVFSAHLAVAPKAAGEEDPDDYGMHGVEAGSAAGAEKVETVVRLHLEQARELAQHLTQKPADAAAARQLEAVTQALVSDADLLDDADLKDRARNAALTAKRLLMQPDLALALQLARLLAPAPVEVPEPAEMAPLPPTQDAADQELMAIFVEEANEVLDSIDEQLQALRGARSDTATLTTVRRAFHTLKGSSRMVGLSDFGEGAWSIEQCFNAWLAQERAATDDLIALAEAARTLMRGWIRRIEADLTARIDPQPLVQAAYRVRDGHPYELDVASLAEAIAQETDLPRPQVEIAEAVAAGGAPAIEAVAEAAAEPIAEPASFLAAEPQPEAMAPIAAPSLEATQSTPVAPLDAQAVPAAAIDAAGGDDLRRIGPVVISHGLYSVFLSEADESVRTLAQDTAEWRFEPERPVSSSALRCAHSLAGITATVGLASVSALAEPLDDLLHEMSRLEHATNPVFSPAQFDSLERVTERMRGMLHQFAAGIYPPPAQADVAAMTELVAYVRAFHAIAVDARVAEAPAEASSPAPVEAAATGQPQQTAGAAAVEPAAADTTSAATRAESAAAAAPPVPAPLSVADDLDPDLLPVFVTEANELLPAVGDRLRALAANPTERAPMRELMRLLHTVKGSARMAGAMRLGELVHDMETRIEAAMQLADLPRALTDDLDSRYDQAMTLFEGLQRGESVALPIEAAAAAPAAVSVSAPQPAAPVAVAAPAEAAPAAGAAAAPAANFVRVRSDVLDKLVDQAGEVLIARSRVENHTSTLKASLADLTENIHRLRTQMRELEIQAEAQIQARSEKLSRESGAFDPLEFDRFTRLQELTRMIAESVEDVATIQGAMLKGLQTTEGDLSAQYRLTRELQQQLMRVRLVPFASISDRLYRVARQAGKELDKRVNVDIRGGRTELDRVVLERMAGPFEHMVRNAIAHGLEPPAARRAAGKPEVGELRIEVRQESNEINIVIADDGAGLDLARIRACALASGVLRADQQPSERELMELIFAPGFSTAAEVTELAGRGVGMDVVRSELAAFGGRIAIASEAGRGTRFTLNLPLTLAVTQVVLASVGGRRYAIPAGMVEQVQRVRPEDVAQAISDGMIDMEPAGEVALRTMAQLLGEDTTLHQGRQVPVILLRSGDDRMAVVVDDVSSNQEVVVKNVGAQVSRLAGILGATILGNGEIVLIINPVQLIVRAPEPPQLSLAKSAVPQPAESETVAAVTHPGVTLASAPLVMVVDDSLTVRRVTQRLLERSGYDVILAKDGVDALRQLQEVRPDVMLVDIEMPRMDGFDLTRNVRASEQMNTIPIVMITSRTADKHRRLAVELGVNAYLGKPYQENELLALIRSYVEERVSA